MGSGRHHRSRLVPSDWLFSMPATAGPWRPVSLGGGSGGWGRCLLSSAGTCVSAVRGQSTGDVTAEGDLGSAGGTKVSAACPTER